MRVTKLAHRYRWQTRCGHQPAELLADPFGVDRLTEFVGKEPLADLPGLSGAEPPLELAAQPGEVLLDVRCGDGPTRFGALPLVGETGQVVFTDISEELLQGGTG